jgi:hypothetical protein
MWELGGEEGLGTVCTAVRIQLLGVYKLAIADFKVRPRFIDVMNVF